MKDQDLEKFVSLMVGTGEVYGREISSHLNDAYWAALSRYELDDVSRAFSEHLVNPDTGQYFPKPADIVKFIDGNTQSNALRAWSKVEKAVRRVGPYQTVVFDDALIHAVLVDMGGWIDLCNMTDQELPFRRNEFEKRYKGFSINAPDKYINKLVGLSEASCNQLNESGDKQFQLPKPVVIGNTQTARLVYKGGSDSVSDINILTDDQLKMTNKMLATKRINNG